MAQKLNETALGFAAAIVAAVIMLLLGIFGNLGIYMGAVEMMMQWHVFFTLSFGGIIAGIIEAAVISFIFAWLFAWTYNKFD